MQSVFLRNGRYAAHVGLSLRPFVGCFGKEMFKSRGSDIDEHTDWLVRIILEAMDRAARGVNAIAREQVVPGTVQKKTNPSFDDIEPLVFALVVVRPRPAARRSHIEKRRELPAGLFGVEQRDYCVAERTQSAAFVGSYQERIGEQ